MFIAVLFTLSITSKSFGSDSVTGNCEKGWEKFGTKCYKIFSNQRDDVSEMVFGEARDFCKKQNPKSGSLVSIHSQEEQDFLTSYLGRPGIKNTVYIGLHRPTQYSPHQWLDGTNVDYTNWVPGEPNNANGNEGCAQMQSHEISAGKWNDIPCDALRDLICQADQDATLPETPSTVECIICPNHTVKYRESCYSTHSQNLNWYDAELTCQDAGGHLVSISDNFEMAFLRQLTTGKFREYWIGLRANIVHSRLFEHKDRHHLAWSDHRPVHHLTWDVDQPKYTEEEDVQCVEMNEDRLWAVSDCIDEKPFVCIKHPNAFTKSSRAEGFCPANIEGVSSRLIDVGHDKCYLVEYKMSEADGFTGSKDKCKDYGGKLAFFKTSDELKSLTPYLAPYANKHFWVGIRMEDHSFKSLDNEDFDENLWEKGEPNELHRERCVNVYAQALKYYNSPCWAPHQYICEIPKVLEIDYDPSKESGSKVESGALEGSGAFEESGMEGSGAFEDSGVLEGGWSDDEDYPDHKTPEGNNKVLQISTPADFVLDGNEDTTIHYSDDKSPEENNNVPETVTLSDFIFDGVEDNSINVYRVDNEI